MARQPQLTIQVNAQQFQQFAQQFNAFSRQIRQLNQNFAQINNQLNRQNILVRGITASMQGLLNVTRSVGSEIWTITKRLVSWGTIIGGVTTLLGFGGGLFGIDRLAQSIMQKRRMVLGLGQDYGRTQANMIFNQGLVGSPGDVMKNIRLGLSGSTDQQTALLAMGIPFGSKMSPDAVMDSIVKKMPDLLNRAGPGNVLRMAQAFKLDKIFTDPMDILRLSTKAGQEEYEQQRKLREQYAELLKITPKATKAWTEFSIQLEAAKAQVESVFGEVLADMATPLKHLSQGFADLVRTFMKTPEVQAAIKFLAKWIDELAKKMNQLTEKDIKDFIETIKGWLPDLSKIGTSLGDFVEILQDVVKILRIFFPKDADPTGWQHPSAHAREQATGIKDAVGNTYRHYKDAIDRIRKGGSLSNDSSTNAPTAAPNVWKDKSVSTTGADDKYSVANPFRSFGLPYSQTGGAPASGLQGWQNSIQGLPSDSKKFSGNWGAATRSMTPAGGDFNDRFGNWRGTSDNPKGGGSRPGPLSMDNWQMNRMANLVIRNVPGSNIFMNAEGMTG